MPSASHRAFHKEVASPHVSREEARSKELPSARELHLAQAHGAVTQFINAAAFGSPRLHAVADFLEYQQAALSLTFWRTTLRQVATSRDAAQRVLAESNLRIAELEYVQAKTTMHHQERTVPGYRGSRKRIEELYHTLLAVYIEALPLEQAQPVALHEVATALDRQYAALETEAN